MAHLYTHSDHDLVRYTRFPEGYPAGSAVAGPWQVPVLAPPEAFSAPSEMYAFDDRKRIQVSRTAALHFYRNDAKFTSVVTKPLEWVSVFCEYGYVLTPDISLGDDMPSWLRQQNTCLSRAVGVIWQRRGLNVIPSLRWRSIEDIPFVVAGISSGSTIAVSNYGSRRELSERMIFKAGLEEILRVLSPADVLLYGSADATLKALIETHSRLHIYKSPIDRQRAQIELASSKLSPERLF